MGNSSKILVVGTTSDYIDWLRCTSPGRALFLTDPAVRQQAREPSPPPDEEILCDLTQLPSIFDAISAHQLCWLYHIAGVACFDCESLALAAALAEDLALPFASPEAVGICRDKHATGNCWRRAGVVTPHFVLASSEDDAVAFLRSAAHPCVLKPVSGSGSELVFRVESESDCRRCARLLLSGVEQRRGNRLYSTADAGFVIEHCVAGAEYSCDFLLEGGAATMLRFSRKIKAPQAPFGTTMGYVLTACEVEGIDRALLETRLAQAAHALGLVRALCMADFLITDETISFLEITPRLGGDCLPFLLRRAAAVDMLQIALDFAEGLPVAVPVIPEQRRYVGLRLHAERAGCIREIDSGALQSDPRVLEVGLIRVRGHRVVLPPDDYESWYLGHAIFAPEPGVDLEEQCLALRRLLAIDMEAQS